MYNVLCNAMIDLIERHQAQLKALCRKHKVKTLELFGSAAVGAFDPAQSDLDFLVEFLPLERGELFDCFFGLWEDLRALFGRKVDLLTPRSITNPIFAEAVARQRQMLYAA